MHNHTLHKHNVYIVCINYNNKLERDVKEWCSNFGVFHINSNGFEMIVYTPHEADAIMFKLLFSEYLI